MGEKQNISEVEMHRLICLSQTGHKTEYREFLLLAQKMLLSFFKKRLSMTRSSGNAEDLAQETLSSIHQKLSTFDINEEVLPWVFAIARYKLIDFFRKNKVALELFEENLVTQHSTTFEFKHDLNRALSTLDARQQQIVRMSKLEELPLEEIAHQTGMSLSNVKVTLHRSLKRMAINFHEDSIHETSN
jgi:RNA polymerase sigma-70 factor, ECF subfamily